jgi:hypothetical protein
LAHLEEIVKWTQRTVTQPDIPPLESLRLYHFFARLAQASFAVNDYCTSFTIISALDTDLIRQMDNLWRPLPEYPSCRFSCLDFDCAIFFSNQMENRRGHNPTRHEKYLKVLQSRQELQKPFLCVFQWVMDDVRQKIPAVTIDPMSQRRCLAVLKAKAIYDSTFFFFKGSRYQLLDFSSPISRDIMSFLIQTLQLVAALPLQLGNQHQIENIPRVYSDFSPTRRCLSPTPSDQDSGLITNQNSNELGNHDTKFSTSSRSQSPILSSPMKNQSPKFRTLSPQFPNTKREASSPSLGGFSPKLQGGFVLTEELIYRRTEKGESATTRQLSANPLNFGGTGSTSAVVHDSTCLSTQKENSNLNPNPSKRPLSELDECGAGVSVAKSEESQPRLIPPFSSPRSPHLRILPTVRERRNASESILTTSTSDISLEVQKGPLLEIHSSCELQYHSPRKSRIEFEDPTK